MNKKERVQAEGVETANNKKPFSRREFLKTAGAAGALALMASPLTVSAKDESVEKKPVLKEANAVDLPTKSKHGDRRFVLAHHEGAYPIRDWYEYDANRSKSEHNGGTIISPTVPFLHNLESYLAGTGETKPNGSGCWIYRHDAKVFPYLFGAHHNGALPPNSTLPATGDDDTTAVKATCRYMQSVAFQPNLYNTFSGGFTLCLPANTFTLVSGDNPLGTTRPRSEASGDAGAYARQNWFIDGQMSAFLWNIQQPDDRFIESHETFTRQRYSYFSVVPCNMEANKGVFYSNIANSGRNATTIHEFHFVQIEPVGLNAEMLKTIGLKRLFQYDGSNLGDRLYTNACEFRQFHVGFYSENLEAVSQRFVNTTMANYVDDAIFFYFRRHGSGFSFSGGELLAKGDNQTIIMTDRLDGQDGGVAGATSQFEILPSRLETTRDKKMTIVDAGYGIIDIYNLIQTAGGTPDPSSVAIIQRGNAVINVHQCHIHGNIAVAYRDTNAIRTVKREYSILLEGCMFTRDLSAMLHYQRADGVMVPYADHRDASFEPIAPVIVRDTNSHSAAWQGMPDANKYIFDRTYFTEFDSLGIDCEQIKLGEWRKSARNYYLNNTEHCVLPALSEVYSLKVTAKKSSYGFIRFSLGGEHIDVDVHSGDCVNKEIIADRFLKTSGADAAGRMLKTEVFDQTGVLVPSPYQVGIAALSLTGKRWARMYFDGLCHSTNEIYRKSLADFI